MHQLADGGKDGGNSLIMTGKLFIESGFELHEATRELFVRGKHLAELHEGAHHVDAHLDGARAVQDGGGHDGSVFGEREGEFTATAAAGL